MECHSFTVIGVNAGSTDTGTAEVTSHIFNELFQIVIALQIFRRRSSFNVEAFGVFFTKSLIDWSKVRDTTAKFFRRIS